MCSATHASTQIDLLEVARRCFRGNLKEVLCILTQEESKTLLIHFDLQAAGEMANVILSTFFYQRNFCLKPLVATFGNSHFSWLKTLESLTMAIHSSFIQDGLKFSWRSTVDR